MKTILYCDILLTPFQPLYNHSIVIETGLISAITAGKVEPTEGDMVIDASNKIVTPGLIDVHVHGASGFDTNDANDEANGTIARFNAKHGVTSFCATTYSGSIENLIASIQAVTNTRWPEDGARQIGMHIEGPFLSTGYRGAQPENALRDANVDEIKRWMDMGKIILITLAPERPGAMEAIRFCTKNEIIPVIGHSEASYEQVIAAAAVGLSQATHTFNGMTGIHHRNPGVTGAVLTDDRIFAEIIADGIHLHPAIVKLVIRAKSPERTILITDAVRAAGMADGVYDLGGQPVTIKDGAPYTVTGHLAGSMLTMDAAVRNVMTFTGLPFESVLPMATATPANSIGMQGKIGVLEPGAFADILFWDYKYNVCETMISGKFISMT